jgi:hypothetical protein
MTETPEPDLIQATGCKHPSIKKKKAVNLKISSPTDHGLDNCGDVGAQKKYQFLDLGHKCQVRDRILRF